MKKFYDRMDAGQQLAKALTHYANRSDVIVLALPRGGVVLGYEISKALNIPLDALLVRKLGVPGYEELAFGAIAQGGVRVLNNEIVNSLGISSQAIEAVTANEQAELDRRNQAYRNGRPLPDLKNRIVILVDDGLATGATMRAAVEIVKKLYPAKIIIAVPVSAPDTYLSFKNTVDKITCLETPEPFYAVGAWYEHFPQTTDTEVKALLNFS